jgi:hypothetical protein
MAPACVTIIKFLNPDKLGKQYEIDMFVGHFNNRNTYHFELNKERTKLNLDSAPEGGLNKKIIFANDFGRVSSVPPIRCVPHVVPRYFIISLVIFQLSFLSSLCVALHSFSEKHSSFDLSVI